jgi:RNA polymerase sigma-70 factor (ECF subfamily)
VLQESFVAVWDRAESFSIEHGRPMTWLITIVRNRCINILRTPGVKTVPLVTADDDGEERTADAVDQSPGPFERLLENCEDALLRGCIERLDPEPRRALLMAF